MTKIPSIKYPQPVNVETITVQDTEEIQVQVELKPGPILKVGKARPNLKPLSVETLAFCEHTKKNSSRRCTRFPNLSILM